MANVFILHGLGCTPEMNRYASLQQDLEKLGHEVTVPLFPSERDITIEDWFAVLESYEDKIHSETIFVGHSLGAIFILSIAERFGIKAAFLVAGCVGKVNERFDDWIKTFTQRDFDWEKIKANCQQFSLFASDNDKYIRFEKFQELADLLDIELDFIPDANHFETDAGFDRFDALLEKVKMSGKG